jgi:hypothetical protein
LEAFKHYNLLELPDVLAAGIEAKFAGKGTFDERSHMELKDIIRSSQEEVYRNYLSKVGTGTTLDLHTPTHTITTSSNVSEESNVHSHEIGSFYSTPEVQFYGDMKGDILDTFTFCGDDYLTFPELPLQEDCTWMQSKF